MRILLSAFLLFSAALPAVAQQEEPLGDVVRALKAAQKGAGSAADQPAAAAQSNLPRLPADDRRFQYEGRFDLSVASAPVVIWQASRISLDFEGDIVSLLFEKAQGQNYFDVRIDGQDSVLEASEGRPMRGATLAGIGAGRHHLTLFKRSEASAGHVAFLGVRLAPGAQAWAPQPNGERLRMEFIGDSITVGACNQDPGADQWDDRSTHDSALSYAALTAAAFSADHRNTAVSGMGVVTGWAGVLAGQAWDGLYPTATSARADLSSWTPDLVFVNLGENDNSYTQAHSQAFPAGFSDGYVALVGAIRSAYPRARIVLLLGGMPGGAQSEPLRQAWRTAVAKLEADDTGVTHYAFTHMAQNHPRVADDQAMSAELVAWLGQQHFMKSYR